MEETDGLIQDRDPYRTRFNEHRKRVTFGEEKKNYYLYEDPETPYPYDKNRDTYKHTQIEEQIDLNDNLEESGVARRKPSKMEQSAGPKPSAKELLLEMIQGLAIPVNSNSSSESFRCSRENVIQNSENFVHPQPSAFNPPAKPPNRHLEFSEISQNNFENSSMPLNVFSVSHNEFTNSSRPLNSFSVSQSEFPNSSGPLNSFNVSPNEFTNSSRPINFSVSPNEFANSSRPINSFSVSQNEFTNSGRPIKSFSVLQNEIANSSGPINSFNERQNRFKYSSRPINSLSVNQNDLRNTSISNPHSAFRYPKLPVPARPPLNNHQIFIVNMANRQSRRWGELNLMVSHEPPWKAINFNKDTESTKELQEKPKQNKSQIGQAGLLKALENSKCESSTCKVRAPPGNRSKLDAAVEKATWNNNEEDEQTDDSNAIGRFVITTERKHLNRLKKLLTNPKLLRQTKSMETRKLLGRDLRLAEIVEVCPSSKQKANKRSVSRRPCESYDPMQDCTSSCEVIQGSQKDTSISDLSELGTNPSRKDSSNDLEQSAVTQKPYFSLKEKMSTWGKLKLVKDYAPPWKVIKTKKTVPEGPTTEIDKRLNRIASNENIIPLTESVDLTDEEQELGDTKNTPRTKRGVPKMMVVPSSRKVDNARGHTSMEIASFVNTKKYGKVPEFILRPFVPLITKSKTIPETKVEDESETKETIKEEEPATEPVIHYAAMKEEATRMNEILRSSAFLFQRNVATPNPVFWNAPVSRQSSIKLNSAKESKKESQKQKAKKVNSHLKKHMELKTMREKDIALAEQIMEQNRQLGFKPGRLSLKELSYRTGLPLDFIKLWDQYKIPLSYYDTPDSFLQYWIPPWKTVQYKSATRIPSNHSQEPRSAKQSRTAFRSLATLSTLSNSQRYAYGFRRYLRKEEARRKKLLNKNQSRSRSVTPAKGSKKRLDDSVSDLEELRRYTPSANVSSTDSQEEGSQSTRTISRRTKTDTSLCTDENSNKEEFKREIERRKDISKTILKRRKVARQSRLREKRPPRQDAQKTVKIVEDPIEDSAMKPDTSQTSARRREYDTSPRCTLTSEDEMKRIKKKIQGIVDKVVDQPKPKLKSKKRFSSPRKPSKAKYNSDASNTSRKNVKCSRGPTDPIEKMTDEEFDLTLQAKISEIRRSKGRESEKEKAKKYFDEGWTTVDDSDVDEYKYKNRVQEFYNTLPQTSSACAHEDEYEDEEEDEESELEVFSNTSNDSMDMDSQMANQPYAKFYKLQEYMSQVAENKVLPVVLRGRVMSAPAYLHMNSTDSLTDLKDADGRPHSIGKKVFLRGCKSLHL